MELQRIMKKLNSLNFTGTFKNNLCEYFNLSNKAKVILNNLLFANVFYILIFLFIQNSKGSD
jgi:hypothetical protein